MSSASCLFKTYWMSQCFACVSLLPLLFKVYAPDIRNSSVDVQIYKPESNVSAVLRGSKSQLSMEPMRQSTVRHVVFKQ
jgi:hypothetical protein